MNKEVKMSDEMLLTDNQEKNPKESNGRDPRNRGRPIDADMGYGRRTRAGLANKIIRASRQNIMVERGMMEQLIMAKIRNNEQTKWQTPRGTEA